MCLEILLPPILTLKEVPEILNVHLVYHSLLVLVDILGLYIGLEIIQLQILVHWILLQLGFVGSEFHHPSLKLLDVLVV